MRISQAALIGTVLLAISYAEVSKTTAISELRKSNPGAQWDEKSVVFADVLCDGKPDTIILGSENKNVLIGVVSPTRSKRTQVLSFPIRSATQNGFCAFPKRIEVFPMDCETEEGTLPGCKPVKGCKEFSVIDDECDSFNFYWDSSRKSLAWWRR